MLSSILTISEIIISILLIAVILMQNKNVSLNLTSMWGWMWTVTKRWVEKVLQNLTIILWTLFVLNSLVFFFIK
jgi:protein translocase SecG subunit